MNTVQGGPALSRMTTELLVQSCGWLLCVLATVMTNVRVIIVVSTEQAVLPQYDTLHCNEQAAHPQPHQEVL